MERHRRWKSRLALAALVAAGCAGKASWDEARDLYVVSLPHGARVDFQGRQVGTTPVSLGIPAPGAAADELVVAVELPGFRPERRAFPRNLAPARLVVVLIPEVPGAPETAPDLDDAPGLQRLARLLADEGRCADALAYLDRVLEVAPRNPVAHRDRGLCFLAVGESGRAVDQLARYLLLAPDAPDAEAIEARLDALRGSTTIDR